MQKTNLKKIISFILAAVLTVVPLATIAFAGIMKDKCEIYGLDTSKVKEEDLNKEVYPVKVIPVSASVYAEKSTADFPDVPDDHWAKDYIYACQYLGYISGYEDGTYRPEDSVTIAEFLKLLSCAFYKYDVYTKRTREPGEHWARGYVTSLHGALLRKEDYPDEVLDNYITRELVSRLMVGFFVFKNRDDNDKDHFDRTEQYLSLILDESEITQSERMYVNSAYSYGLMNGFNDGTFRPKAPLTRAQAAKLVYELVGISNIIKCNYEITTTDGTTYNW